MVTLSDPCGVRGDWSLSIFGLGRFRKSQRGGRTPPSIHASRGVNRVLTATITSPLQPESVKSLATVPKGLLDLHLHSSL